MNQTAVIEDSTHLQQSILLRVCKQVLPPGTNIQKEAKDALQRATTVFINYLTATALDLQSQKKTINAQDVFKALELLELDASILGPVKEAVGIYQSVQKQKRTEYRKRKAEEAGGDPMQVDQDEEMPEDDAELEAEDEMMQKRQSEYEEQEAIKKLKQ